MQIPKQKRIRDKEFRKWLSTQPCIRCGMQGYSQAAHFERGGMAIKGGDDSCRPLCAARPWDLGCHKKMDLHLDNYWTKEKRNAAIDLNIYELWRSGEKSKAELEMRNFK